jgi:hypothetical protein
MDLAHMSVKLTYIGINSARCCIILQRNLQLARPSSRCVRDRRRSISAMRVAMFVVLWMVLLLVVGMMLMRMLLRLWMRLYYAIGTDYWCNWASLILVVEVVKPGPGKVVLVVPGSSSENTSSTLQQTGHLRRGISKRRRMKISLAG